MRIAQIAPPWFPVPPDGYGGTERVVALLADGLAARGHDVTLFASGGSRSRARIQSPMPVAPDPVTLGNTWDDAYHASAAYLHAGEYDLIHDHSGIIGACFGALMRGGPPVVHTLHGPWHEEARRQLALLDGRLHLVAISGSQQASNPYVRYAGVVHHGLDPDELRYCGEKEERLAFLGRSSPDKGILDALAIAERTGRPMTMMVKISEPDEKEYWSDTVEPQLNADIEVIVNADHDTKVEELGRARAMVFPMCWDEPFGLVMIEALACGTPVIVTERGSASEIVTHGESGFLVDPDDPVEGSVAAVARLDEIDPAACRRRFETHFSASRMVDQYDELFGAIIRRAGYGTATRVKTRRLGWPTELDPGLDTGFDTGLATSS
jgi:glycosyltransferase involved in cell wall biosynthesis